MNRDEILRTAAQYVTKDRAAQHGDAERNFARIADLWTTYLGVPVLPTDVALMMALLKIARAQQNPGNEDSWVDIAGYAACGGELATTEDVVVETHTTVEERSDGGTVTTVMHKPSGLRQDGMLAQQPPKTTWGASGNADKFRQANEQIMAQLQEERR